MSRCEAHFAVQELGEAMGTGAARTRRGSGNNNKKKRSASAKVLWAEPISE
jgi:hypothetical protein